MALSTPTSLNTAVNNLNGSTLTSGTFSPTGGAILVVCWTGQGAPSGVTAAVTDTLTGTGTWTHYQFEQAGGANIYAGRDLLDRSQSTIGNQIGLRVGW